MADSNDLRVFISSTFQDLQEEREHLVKKIFPEIRALCRERGIRFTEVDLRWGLTDEQIALGQVIRTCLEEIDKCRPYFIGITGDRYGFVPSYLDIQKDPSLLEQYPWIEDVVIDQMSITEMEAHYAVLGKEIDRHRCNNALFYFRRHRKSLEDDKSDDEEWRRLEVYQQRIGASDVRVEHFRDAGSLGELIYDDLIEIIKRDFSEAKPPTPLEEERMRHEAFSLSRRRAYIANPVYLKRLNDHVASDKPPLIVYAESGSGKSALFAYWAEQYRRKHPDAHVIEHYVGIGATATAHYAIIRHICMEINERFGREEEIPSEPAKLDQALGQWLGYADHELQKRGERMVLIVDGLNQLQGTALNLRWIPDVIPPSIRLILSSTVEGTLVELRKRGWLQFGMQALSEAERETIIVRYLAEYRKSLNLDQIRRIATDYKCGHPLFLKTVLEELRLVGRHEELDANITSYLEATGTEDLFQRLLERLEEDFNMRAVRDAMVLLAASRSGLDERELSEISGIARLKIATIMSGLDYHLVRKEDRLTFFHDYLRRAVEKRYLSEVQKKRGVHEQLAAYFERAPVTLRATRELLHALEMLGERERLEAALSQIDRFREFAAREPNEVLRLWSSAEPAAVAAAYRVGLERWGATEGEQDRGAMLGQIAGLLAVVGAWREAQALQGERLLLAHEHGDRLGEASARSSLGWLLSQQGEYEQAFEELSRARDLYADLGDRRGVSQAINTMGHLYINRRDFDRALECLQQSETICRDLGDRRGRAGAIHNIARAYVNQGRYSEGMERYEEALEINRSIGNQPWMANNLNNMGLLYHHHGEYSKALECYRQTETIYRELGDRPGLAGVMQNTGAVYLSKGEYSEAMAQYEEALEINQNVGNRPWMANALVGMGDVYLHRGKYDRAMECYRQSEAIRREIGDRWGEATVIGNMGLVYNNSGEYERALECFRQQEAICRELDDRGGLSITIGNMGCLYTRLREYEQALECFLQATREHRAIGYRAGVADWLEGTAQVLAELVETGGQEMPEFLPQFVPDAEPATWRAISLRKARQQAEECVAIARDLSRQGTLFNGQLVLARITAAEGDVESALAALRGMFGETDAVDNSLQRDQQRAELHYTLWKLNAAGSDHRSEAHRLYKALVETTPNHVYRNRIDELMRSCLGP